MIRDLLKLLDDIDTSDMDIEVNSTVGTIKPNRDSEKDGAEKYEAKRKVKRFNHLLNKSDSGLSADAQSEEDPLVSVMESPETAGVRVTVDSKAVGEIEDGTLRVSVPEKDYSERHEVDLESPAITAQVYNNGVTTIEVQPE